MTRQMDDAVWTTVETVRLRVDRVPSTGEINNATRTVSTTGGPSNETDGPAVYPQHTRDGGFMTRGARKSDDMFRTFASGGRDVHGTQAQMNF